MQKEIQQYHNMETYYPANPAKLALKEKKEAVEAPMILVRKGCGCIKARGYGHVSMQNRSLDYQKEDAASPTVHNDAAMPTSAIDAYKRYGVMLIDCPGALLKAFASSLVVMCLSPSGGTSTK